MVYEESQVKVQRSSRAIYLRPFLLFWLGSFITELFLLSVGIFVFSGPRQLVTKIVWTLVICPLGMGGAMGGLINVFVTDHYYGLKAAWFVAVLTILVLGSCNHLCYNLDHFFNFFGSVDHPWWFHGRYPLIFIAGYHNGKMLFTEEGEKQLDKLGL